MEPISPEGIIVLYALLYFFLGYWIGILIVKVFDMLRRIVYGPIDDEEKHIAEGTYQDFYGRKRRDE